MFLNNYSTSSISACHFNNNPTSCLVKAESSLWCCSNVICTVSLSLRMCELDLDAHLQLFKDPLKRIGRPKIDCQCDFLLFHVSNIPATYPDIYRLNETSHSSSSQTALNLPTKVLILKHRNVFIFTPHKFLLLPDNNYKILYEDLIHTSVRGRWCIFLSNDWYSFPMQ